MRTGLVLSAMMLVNGGRTSGGHDSHAAVESTLRSLPGGARFVDRVLRGYEYVVHERNPLLRRDAAAAMSCRCSSLVGRRGLSALGARLEANLSDSSPGPRVGATGPPQTALSRKPNTFFLGFSACFFFGCSNRFD